VITYKKCFNALLILLLSIWAGSIQADEPLATAFTPNIIIENENNELLNRDVEGKLMSKKQLSTRGY
jgi:hypothetical protein